jgi:hypothetical protein
MFDANGNALLSPGEWLAVWSVLAGTGFLLCLAVVASVFPNPWEK